MPEETQPHFVPVEAATLISVAAGPNEFLISFGRTVAAIPASEENPDIKTNSAWIYSVSLSPIVAKQLLSMLAHGVSVYEKNAGQIPGSFEGWTSDKSL